MTKDLRLTHFSIYRHKLVHLAQEGHPAHRDPQVLKDIMDYPDLLEKSDR